MTISFSVHVTLKSGPLTSQKGGNESKKLSKAPGKVNYGFCSADIECKWPYSRTDRQHVDSGRHFCRNNHFLLSLVSCYSPCGQICLGKMFSNSKCLVGHPVHTLILLFRLQGTDVKGGNFPPFLSPNFLFIQFI